MQSKKHIESQFVCKLIDMMEKYPELIRWNEDGTEMCLVNIDEVVEVILPEYFRHSNFNSFLRQLNMYSFHKTQRTGKFMAFKNEIFKKGNQHNFFLIQRKKKFKQLENFPERFQKDCHNIIEQIKQKHQISTQVQQTLISLLEFKYVSYENIRRMKCQLDGIYKELKDSRNKKVQELCKEIKHQLIVSINQLTAEAKKIDELVQRTLAVEPASQETKDYLSNPSFHSLKQEYHPQRPEPRDDGSLSFNRNLSYSNSRDDSSDRKFSDFRENMRSFNSFPMLYEDFRSKRQYSYMQPKLYNPFTSQQSLMYIPNYISHPSHVPNEDKEIFQQTPKQEEKKEQCLQVDHQIYEGTSFVQDLSQDEENNQQPLN